jgi:hypothetical protein
MPFRDPDARRRYDRDRRRLERAAGRTAIPDITPRYRVRLASDVEAILARAVELATSDTKAKGVEKARALAQIASVGLRLIEAANLSERLDALEDVLELRRGA